MRHSCCHVHMLAQSLGSLETVSAQCLSQDLSQDFCRTLHPGGNSAKFGCLAADCLTHWGNNRDQLGTY